MSKQLDTGNNRKEIAVARYLTVGNGGARVAVAENLTVTNGRVRKAIVFKSIQGGNGAVDELYCLEGVEIVDGNGSMPTPKYLPLDEMIKMALDESGLTA